MKEIRRGVQEEGIAIVLDSNMLITIIIASSNSRAYQTIEK